MVSAPNLSAPEVWPASAERWFHHRRDLTRVCGGVVPAASALRSVAPPVSGPAWRPVLVPATVGAGAPAAGASGPPLHPRPAQDLSVGGPGGSGPA